MSPLRFLFRPVALAALLWSGLWLRAAEHIPAAPTRFFTDRAGLVSAATAEALDRQLEQYERESSNQLLVAIFPRMESDSSVEDFTVRIAEAWKAGQRSRNNGAILFVFRDDHQLYIQVGYGLEATLTDARAHDIVENILKPGFRAGNFDAGLRAAVGAMIAATKGEYHGSGRTQGELGARSANPGALGVVFGLLVVAALFVRFAARGWVAPLVIGSPLRRQGSGRNVWWTSGGGGFGGGGSGGGFSGGGGSFGGGGAGGKW